MADMMKLTGFKELAESLKELGPRVAKNSLRRAVSAGATIIKNEARNLAPVDTGEMRRDIMVKRERESQKGGLTASYSVFVRTGKRSRLAGRRRDVQRDSFYWRFVEFGTSKMAARPFLVPAFDLRREDAVAEIGQNLREGIAKAAKEGKK